MRTKGKRKALYFVLAGLAGTGVGCGERSSSEKAALAGEESALEKLRVFESARRAKTDFAALPPSDKNFGADPYSIKNVPGTGDFVAILRGQDAVILLDGELHEIARAKAPRSPTGLAVTAAGDVFVSGEMSPVILKLRAQGAKLELVGEIRLPDVKAIRGVAAGTEPGVIYAVEERDGRLITLTLGDAPKGGTAIPFQREDAAICSAATSVARVGSRVIVDCVVDHEIIVRKVDAKGAPIAEGEARIKHDGPLWSFDALSGEGGEMLLAAGGVEDHPLDRTEGSFGFIDSFVFVYRINEGGGPPSRLAEVNVSALGVITPKALRLARTPNGDTTIHVTGYGGDKQATLLWRGEARGEPEAKVSDLYPGTAAMAEGPGGVVVYANTLLDAFLVQREGGAAAVVPVVAAAGTTDPDPQRRLGEALFFTSLMAPWNKTEGRLSRFTCETCHFEGYVDGRTHHTGRGDVRATTKPLLGLFNNRPHFSRALDPDLSSIAHNEFRVAGANSGHDPWFSLDQGERPILSAIGAGGAISPVDLRIALMSFLMSFTHRPNPAAAGRTSFTPLEREGAAAFRDHCEGCHNARLSADEPGSRMPFERWEGLVLSEAGPIVWGSNDYKKTGVEPYVHEKGARVPSLRRLYKKRPYFTNGSALSIAEVLDRARPIGDAFYHGKVPPELSPGRLHDKDQAAIAAFLDLL